MESGQNLIDLLDDFDESTNSVGTDTSRSSFSQELVNAGLQTSIVIPASPAAERQEDVTLETNNSPPLPPKRQSTGGQHLFERLKNAGYNVSSTSDSARHHAYGAQPNDQSSLEGKTFDIVETVKGSAVGPILSTQMTESKIADIKSSIGQELQKCEYTSVSQKVANSGSTSSSNDKLETNLNRPSSQAPLQTETDYEMNIAKASSNIGTPLFPPSSDDTILLVDDSAYSKHAHFIKRDTSLSRASFRGPQIVPPILFGRIAKADDISPKHDKFCEQFGSVFEKGNTNLIQENFKQLEDSGTDNRVNNLSKEISSLKCANRLSASTSDLLHADIKEKPYKNLSAQDLKQLLIDKGLETTYNGPVPNNESGCDRESSLNSSKKPPERPPAPLKHHRFSAPLGININLELAKRSQIKSEHYESLFFGDGMFDVVEERNEEAVAFCRSVADLRKLYLFNDAKNPGYISCPRFACNPDSVADEQKLWKIVIFLDPQPQPREFMCNLTLRRNEVIARALSLFKGEFNALDYLSDQFVFKVVGYSMYITGNYPMIDYTYVQDCLRLEKDLKLSLVQTDKIVNELARTKQDDAEEFLGRYFYHFFENETQTGVSRQGLLILLEAYNKEIVNLMEGVTNIDYPLYIPDRLIQTVKAISMSLAYIETVQIQEAIQLLISIKPKDGERKAFTMSRKGVKNFNRYIDPKRFDKGRFHLALEKLTNAVTSLVSLYCKAFDTDFNISKFMGIKVSREEARERIDVREIHDKFCVKIASVHRIPLDWKMIYDYFEVECGLYYGTNPLGSRLLTKLSKPCDGLFEHIQWNEVLIFDIRTCELPREVRISFCLYGLKIPSKRTSGDSKSRHLLGWIVKNAFDFNGLLLSGSLLVGLLNCGDLNPAATCASSYIQQQNTVIMKVDFEVYHSDVIFPELFVPPITAKSASSLYLQDPEILLRLEDILSKRSPRVLNHEEKGILWNSRLYCRNIPKALAFVLTSAPKWDAESVAEIHDLLSSWEPLTSTMALELLKADYPDNTVRKFAVQWLSSITEDELCSYLPQLVQGIKFESYHNSELARFLIRKSLSSPRVAHYFFWHLRYYIGDPQFCQRFQIVLGGFLSVCGASLRDQLSRQDRLVSLLDEFAKKVKGSKDNIRLVVLRDNLNAAAEELNFCYRLPIDPASKVKEIIPEECSFFSSYTVPLSLVFRNSDPRGDNISVIFKMGDDLRKDLITLQLTEVMDKLWLKEGVDLRMLTYHCMPTGPSAGMIEIIKNCSTLREIHSQFGVTGSFKDDSILLWLQKFNIEDVDYEKAVKNFTASCAGCCVTTYVLGIGDRHNDNVMITQKGHMFHIDFSKFMGNVQKFGSIKRDRVPFVFTPDMAYVINGSDEMTSNFQQFVEYCCQAFNILRHNAALILNLLGLMVSSEIPYLSDEEDIEYVEEALQLQLSDAEATSYFTRLIESSLTSKATQLNFFIHNVAHIKDAGHSLSSINQRSLYSFTNKIYSAESDGQLVSARVVDFQKRYVPEKHYIFVINVVRKNQSQPSFVFRRYDEFQELHDKIMNLFSNTQLPQFPGKILVGRSQVREVAVKRRKDLDAYLDKLTKIPIVFRSEILYTFLHSYIRDKQDTSKFAEIFEMLEEGGPQSRIGGELKFSYCYRGDTLNVLVMHARNLVPRSMQGYAEPYVKAYLLPDPTKATKRKTKVIRKNLNPTFNETLSFQIPLNLLQRRVLQLTAWDHDTMHENHFLGGINVYLSTVDLSKEQAKWYKLKDLGT